MSGVDNPRRRVVKGLAQIVVVEIQAHKLHVLMRRPRRRIGDEAKRVGQSLFQVLEPDKTARQSFRVGCERDGLHVNAWGKIAYYINILVQSSGQEHNSDLCARILGFGLIGRFSSRPRK
jgi:hypothetical protein